MYIYNVPTQFRQVVKKLPEKVALKFKENEICFRELDDKSNQLAAILRDRGIRKNDVILIVGRKTPLVFFAQFASLKLGAPYCFYDPETPLFRLQKIINTCKPKICLVDKATKETVKKCFTDSNRTINIDDPHFVETLASVPIHDSPERDEPCGSDPAYIMFTSGSMGEPKGAVMSHANVLNFISWAADEFGITSNDVLTNVNPIYFDNSVFDIYASIFNGACLVPLDKDGVIDPEALVNAVEINQCTIWFSVPSLFIFLMAMKALDSDRLMKIRTFIFGGEGFPKSKLKQFYEIFGNRSQLINVYGPTECTCICSTYKITEDDFETETGIPPIGKLIRNFSYLIRGESGQLAEPHEVGELCLMGPNVGFGYYNNASMTTKAFLAVPGDGYFREIMYATGDLFRLGEDGKLYFVGRRDNQIKHMGYRIEVEEIEAALYNLEYLQQAVVFQIFRGGFSQIVAVICVSDDTVGERRVKKDLSNFVPRYMIPGAVYKEADLRKNANGKIDRVWISTEYQKMADEEEVTNP